MNIFSGLSKKVKIPIVKMKLCRDEKMKSRRDEHDHGYVKRYESE